MFGLGNGEFFKWLKLFAFPKASLALSVEHPDWCNATLDLSNFELPMDKDFNSATVKLKISEIPSDAPALEMDHIKVNAVFWGFIWSTSQNSPPPELIWIDESPAGLKLNVP